MNENINDLDARLAQAENALAVKDEQVSALLAEVQRLRARLAPFERLERHIAKAKAKHGHFADTVDFPWCAGNARYELKNARGRLKSETTSAWVTARSVLDCELAEVYEAWHAGRYDDTEDECYDAMAVLVRMVELVRKEKAENEEATCSPHGGAWPKKPKPPRIECPPDLQAAGADADAGE